MLGKTAPIGAVFIAKHVFNTNAFVQTPDDMDDPSLH